MWSQIAVCGTAIYCLTQSISSLVTLWRCSLVSGMPNLVYFFVLPLASNPDPTPFTPSFPLFKMYQFTFQQKCMRCSQFFRANTKQHSSAQSINILSHLLSPLHPLHGLRLRPQGDQMAVIDYCKTLTTRWWIRHGRRVSMGMDSWGSLAFLPWRQGSRVWRAAQRPALRDMSVRGAISGNYILLLIIKGVGAFIVFVLT